MKDQTKLDRFGFKLKPRQPEPIPVHLSSSPESIVAASAGEENEETTDDTDSESEGEEMVSATPVNDNAEEDWEEELDTRVLQPEHEIQDWAALREQINKDLKKTSALSRSQINQLLIIRNFANLHLKGLSRIKASTEIAKQWHEGKGIYFSRRVRALAWH